VVFIWDGKRRIPSSKQRQKAHIGEIFLSKEKAGPMPKRL